MVAEAKRTWSLIVTKIPSQNTSGTFWGQSYYPILTGLWFGLTSYIFDAEIAGSFTRERELKKYTTINWGSL
jgi:hypothetical protein